MSAVRFTGPILAGHKQAAIEVPCDPGERWGVPAVKLREGRRGYKVRATISGIALESAVVRRSGRFWLLLELQQLAAVSAAIGKEVTVQLEQSGK